MPVKFWHTSLRFWFFLSYLITTVPKINSFWRHFFWKLLICISYFFLTESPFNNIHDEIKNHPMSFLWRKMPWFKWFFTGTLTKNDVGFISDQRIGQIYVPILIMHAKVSARKNIYFRIVVRYVNFNST